MVGAQAFPVRYTARDAATNPRSWSSKAGEATGAGGMKGGGRRLGGSGRHVFPETNEWLHLKMAEVGFFYIFLFGANLSNFRGYVTCSF